MDEFYHLFVVCLSYFVNFVTPSYIRKAFPQRKNYGINLVQLTHKWYEGEIYIHYTVKGTFFVDNQRLKVSYFNIWNTNSPMFETYRSICILLAKFQIALSKSVCMIEHLTADCSYILCIFRINYLKFVCLY